MTTITGFQGRVLEPGHDGYDEARTLFNTMIDRRPAVIAQCGSADDVAAAIRFGRGRGLDIAVRAGGHSVAGTSLNDGGLVIDVRPLDEVAIDPERRIGRVGGGCTWAQFDSAAQEHGLATTGGRVSTTGVTGLTLGGGSGWLERSLGLACDNLHAVELVTADGRHVRASEDEHPELFWALHGGGGNFGVATALEFRLHPVGPRVFAGLAFHDPALAPEVLRLFRDFVEDAPDGVGPALLWLTAPAEDFMPQEWHDRPVVATAGLFHGPVEEGREAFRPLRETLPTIADIYDVYSYAEFNSMIDDPPGYRNWWTAEYLSELTDEAMEVVLGYSAETPPAPAQSLLIPWGGQVARVEGTPLAKRDAAWVAHPFALWADAADDVERIAWGRAFRQALEPYATGGVYLNFVGDEGDERIRAAYGESYERLAAVKAEWDPDNVFRGNQNISPAAATVEG